MVTCKCGAPDCWDEDDSSWLASRSGWSGTLYGCDASVFFIHGKRIREQRTPPAGSWRFDELPALLAYWSTGLPNARLVWSADNGCDEAELYIEGEREPNEADLLRLQKVREQRLFEAEQERRLLRKLIGSILDQ